MLRALTFAPALLLALSAGCEGDGAVTGGDAGLDGAMPVDATPPDGAALDGGPAPDGGPAEDASTPDGGPPTDTCASSDDCDAGEYCRHLAGCDGAGACEPRPEGCSREYVPVCGCDGMTYGNACNAASAGVTIASPGECGGPAECIRNDQCARSEYCEGESCGGTGVCAARPEACTEEYDPVCGCDGVTYGNPCEAAAAGMRVAADGACAVPPQACTGNDECDASDYCEGRSCAGVGACVARPELCTREYAPVCGCNGVTYWNGCEAARAGARVASPGECAPPSIDCISNRECNDDQFCAGETCGSRGTCTTRPGACPAIYDPVCGCDGMTYGNACSAASAGMRVAYAGECRTTTACTSNTECARSEYCVGRSCGGSGHCEPRPTSCDDVEDPVCGCDEVTYVNPCEAAVAGARVAAPGACITAGCLSNLECSDGQYCNGRSCAGPGSCEARPEVCLGVFDPVCGCDGRTYGNPCEAAAAGARVSYPGRCEPVSPECRSDADCGGRQYCAECRGIGGAIRVCLPRGSAC